MAMVVCPKCGTLMRKEMGVKIDNRWYPKIVCTKCGYSDIYAPKAEVERYRYITKQERMAEFGR